MRVNVISSVFPQNEIIGQFIKACKPFKQGDDGTPTMGKRMSTIYDQATKDTLVRASQNVFFLVCVFFTQERYLKP